LNVYFPELWDNKLLFEAPCLLYYNIAAQETHIQADGSETMESKMSAEILLWY
jgi:hypothetical protein